MTIAAPRLSFGLAKAAAEGMAASPAFRTCSALLLTALSACSSVRAPTACQPWRLSAADSVVLAEEDTAFVGMPGASITVGIAGEWYIPDASQNRVLVFSPSGSLIRILGRQGQGPGEFSGVGPFGVAVDSLVLIPDFGGRRLNVYHATGAAIGSIPYDGYLARLGRDRSTVWLGLLDLGNRRALLSVSAERLRHPEAIQPLVASLVATPAQYREYPRLLDFSDVAVAATGDTLVYGFGGLSFLVRTVLGATTSDTVVVPTCGRRGSPLAAVGDLLKRRPRTPEEDLSVSEQTAAALSALLNIWRLETGEYLIWYQDPVIESRGRILKGVAFLSILSPDLRRACVDARIEAPGIGRPRLGLAGDTVLVLDQVVSAAAPDRATTVVRKYPLDRSTCQWVSTAPGA